MAHDWEKKELLRVKYNTTAPGYDELYGDEQYSKYEAAKHILEKILIQTLCDIGAGTLLLRKYLTEIGMQYSYHVALDLSEGMLDVAKRRRDATVELVQADAEHLPLRDKSCSVAVSFTVIDLLPSPGKLLSECRRASQHVCIISSLKKAQKLSLSATRAGKYIGETDKDILLLLEP